MILLENYPRLKDCINCMEPLNFSTHTCSYTLYKPNYDDDDDVVEKKLNNAKKSFGKDIGQDEKLFLLIDRTLFGSAKEGIILSDRKIYYKEFLSKPNVINYKDVDRILVSHSDKKINFILGDEIKTIGYGDGNIDIMHFTQFIIGASYLIRAANAGLEIDDSESFIWDVYFNNVSEDGVKEASKLDEFFSKYEDTIINIVDKFGIDKFLFDSIKNDEKWDEGVNRIYDLLPAPIRFIISRDKFSSFIFERRDLFAHKLGIK